MGLFIDGIDTEATVLQIRAKAIEAFSNGASVVSWSSEGTSVSKQFTLPVKEVIQECNNFLQSINPSLYGKRVRRTVPRFTY